jgi:hypothetical protein
MKRDHEFTADWLSFHVNTWRHLLSHLAGRPNLAFLEIGCFEGRATTWYLENILTHETSSIDCIDTFEGSVEHPEMGLDADNIETIFDRNIKASHAGCRVHKTKGSSQENLRNFPLNHYDLIYIDGSHMAADVLEDAVLSFRLLKDAGIMIFDDYEWQAFLDDVYNPKLAIDAFLETFRGRYELLSKGYQVIVQKVPGADVRMRVQSRAARNPDYAWADEGWIEGLNRSRREIMAVIPPGDTFILVDQAQWGAGRVLGGRRCLPFLERDGQYWGPPPDEATAIRELERLRRAGAEFVVVAWPAFWWLDHYDGLHRHLRSAYRCVLKNDRLVVFDLRPAGREVRADSTSAIGCLRGEEAYGESSAR